MDKSTARLAPRLFPRARPNVADGAELWRDSRRAVQHHVGSDEKPPVAANFGPIIDEGRDGHLLNSSVLLGLRSSACEMRPQLARVPPRCAAVRNPLHATIVDVCRWRRGR